MVKNTKTEKVVLCDIMDLADVGTIKLKCSRKEKA